MADLKRTYTIPLRRGFNNTQKYRRAKRAVSLVKEFIAKHMKSENVKIGPQLNLKLWERGIRNPPHKVTVDVTKDKEGVVRAELEGIEYKETKQQEKATAKGTKEKLQEKLQSTMAAKQQTDRQNKDANKLSKKPVEMDADTKEAKEATAETVTASKSEKPAAKKAPAKKADKQEE